MDDTSANLHHSPNDSSNHRNACHPAGSQLSNPFQGMNELIANLDHELWDVRLRALKCIIGKVECSIVTTDYLSRRIDLLHRLSDWLRATSEATEDKSPSSDSRGRRCWSVNTAVAVEGISYVLKLLFYLVEYENVRQFVLEEKLDSVLAKLKPRLDGENIRLVDTLFSRINTSSFEFLLEGSPEIWGDNTSNRSLKKNTSTEKSYSYEDKFDDNRIGGGVGDIILIRRLDHKSLDKNMSDHSAAGDSYFPNQSLQSILNNKSLASGFHFTISSVYLAGTDRRVLASTVESLLSKNEPLILSTASFFRDVLLQDYPPEVFIQESALCMALLEVAESPWNDPRIATAASQGLLQLSHSLRVRVMQLNASEFYETKRQAFIPNQYGGASSAYTSQHRISAQPISDSFVGTCCQLLKGLSRTLLFHANEFHLWMLLDSFALTVCKYAYTFPIDYKMLSLGLQEVLLDLAYCYEKHGQDINSTVLAMCFASIMKTIQVNDEVFILAYDIRQCVRKLSRCPLLSNGWPEVHKYFVQYSSPLVDSLSSDPDVPNTRGFEDSFQLEPNQKQFYFQPQEAISKLLIAIQNATGHQTVILAIDNLWGYILPLAVNQRWKNGAMDYICQEVPFRDSFYRFLCVEPTCVEDEDLLIRVINLIAYLFANLSTGREKLEEWIVPLCMENGSAFQKLLRTYCLKSDITDVFAGTVLPDTLRSLFDFLFVILKKTEPNPSYAEYKWNIFHTLCLILHKLGDLGFSFSVVLQPILRGIASLSCVNDVTAQLAQNPKFCVALILRLTEFIIFLQEQSSGLSSESFRNQGALYYSSLSLYHVLLISFEIEAPPNSDWIGPCCAVIPCLWDSRTSKVRTLGYQISEVISRRIQGIVALMTVSESPDRIWTSCYNALINFEEPAIVKLHAAHTLYNLLLLWDDIERSTEIGKSLQLPTTWSVLDEFTKLLSHVYWLPTLSEVFGNKAVEDSTMTDEDNSNPQLITPKVLTVLCKIVIKMKTSLLPPFHPEPFSGIICSSGLCAMLFRLVGTNSMSQILEASWWIDSCSALSSVLESLISLCEIDRGISLILIGDKHSMISLIQLLALQPPSGCKLNLADETLSTLWVNVFTLLTILCTDSGNNFEDFERCISNQRNIIFVRLTEWLKSDALAVCRKMALTFLHEILSKLQFKQEEKEADNFQAGGHPILCRVWNEKNMTYGSSLVDRLVSIYEESSTHEEKLIILRTFNALINISESAKITATQRGVVNILILKLKYFAHKYHNVSETFHQMKKFQGNYQWLDETATILSVISSLVYKNPDGKKSALSNEVVDTFHKIFKWWKAYPDRTLLHGFVETLLNFTEEFPPGCQALTFTTNVLGVGPRKAPSGQSILSEIFEILQAELNLAESCNLKTVELLFEFLKNASFVMECRTMLTKSTIILFLINLHTSEIKKWSPKQHRVKLLYLEFLLHLSIHPDMQTAIAKVPEAIDIFVLLVDQGDDMTSVLALQVLRNLSFQAMNRTRLLCEDAVMPCLSSKLSESDHPKEMECAAVAVWALIANSEKGKLSAKKSLCPIAVQKTITRLRKLEQSSNDLLTKKQDLSNLINILTNISNLLGSSPST